MCGSADTVSCRLTPDRPESDWRKTMIYHTMQLTKQEKQVLESYRSTVKALASYLGDAYEIVLHSLENPEHSVIEIANGFHTGRSIGSPITDLAVKWLKHLESCDKTVNHYSYYSKNRNGEPLKSCTIAIRGNRDRIIGLICINLYLGTPFLDLMSDMIPQETSTFVSENFLTSSSAVDTELRKAREQVLSNTSIPDQQRKKEIIRILYRHNVFNIKNAVEQVANDLGLSIKTVYFHLRNIAKEE